MVHLVGLGRDFLTSLEFFGQKNSRNGLFRLCRITECMMLELCMDHIMFISRVRELICKCLL